jgi:Protein of unknown function with HXXEE motif
VALQTYGRWPVVGAIAAPGVTALAVNRPALRPLAALLWHQTEEWVWPGRFLPWINREVLGSDRDEFPLDRRIAFTVNVVFGWGFSTAPLSGAAGAQPAAALYASHLGNATLHLGWAARHRRYDPGALTAAAMLLPISVIGLRGLVRDPAVPARRVRAGIVTGIASPLLPLSMRGRIRRVRRR